MISQEIEYELKKILMKSRSSIQICVAWINMSLFSDIFKDLIASGVKIEIICNDDITNRSYAVPAPIGVDVHFFKPLKRGIIHHKFVIIDDEVVCSGSYNWSKNAHNNFENIMVAQGNVSVVVAFQKIFEELKAGLLMRNTGVINETGKCKICRSTTYNLLLISYINIDSSEDEDVVYLLTICQKNNHILKIIEEPQYFFGDFFQEDPEDDDPLYEPIRLQNEWQRVMGFYKKKLNIDIHVIGLIESNFNAYTKGYASDLEYLMKIHWRDPNYTNMIPDKIEIDTILNEIEYSTASK